MPASKYDVSAIRNKLRQQTGKFVDPDEFKPPKAKDGETLKFRFFILPPISEGDELKTGAADQSMGSFVIPHGTHWLNNKPYACPRVTNGEDCPACQTGFDLIKDITDKDQRKKILSTWMPATYYMVNIFFPNSKINPEELRGKVKYLNAPKTCFDLWEQAIYREDKGMDEDPQAFGPFFDENAAFLFQLEVSKNGLNNSYKSSGFLPNNGEPIPMLTDESKLPKLLSQRIDLFSKIDKPDVKKLTSVVNYMIDGDDMDDDAGFDQDDTKPAKSESKKSEVKKTEKTKAEKSETIVEDDLSGELADDDDDELISDDISSDDDDDDAPFDSSDDDDEIDSLLEQLD